MAAPNRQDLPSFYEHLWLTAKLNTDRESKHEIDVAFAKALKRKGAYLRVQERTSVPWQLIAGLDMRECNFRENRCLHNGQRLDAVTTLVPQGRGPFPNWEVGAIDALNIKKMALVKEWPICKVLEWAEKYNGQGYLLYHPNVPSPYLWSMTNHYTTGKYSRDGIFDLGLQDKQVGVAALLLKFAEQGLMDEISLRQG